MNAANGDEVGPLQRSIARLNGETEWLRGEIGPARAGWVVAAEVRREAAFRTIEEPSRRETGGADPRTVGAALVSRYAYPAGLAALLYLRERRVPDLAPGRVAFATHEGDEPTRVALAGARFSCLPDDPGADHPDARPVAGPDALRARLAMEIVSYLEPAIEPLYERTRLGRKALWGRGAALPLSALAWELNERGRPHEGKQEADRLAGESPVLARVAPSFEVVETRRGALLTVTEGACCRSYRWIPSEGKCDSCPLLPVDERVRLQREQWEAAAGQAVGDER